MTNRTVLLEELIQFKAPLPKLLDALSQYGWDSKGALIQLQCQEIVSILQRYLQDDLDASDIEQWANAIEGRDDIGYEEGQKKIVLSVIHELANPVITKPFNKQIAQEVISQLIKPH